MKRLLTFGFFLGWPMLSMPAFAQETEDCLVLPGQEIEVGGSIPGQLSEVHVDIGDRVEKGQLIASLTTDVQEALVALAEFRASNTAAVSAAEARLEYERRELERAETLRERGVATAASADERQTAVEIRLREFEEAQMNLKQAALELERAQAELAIRSIVAPIDGIVSERALDAGEYLRDDETVVTIVSVNPLLVEAFFRQEDYDKIRVGMEADVIAETAPDQSHRANVKTTDAVIDAASATFRVRFTLPNDAQSIIAGVRCHVMISEP